MDKPKPFGSEKELTDAYLSLLNGLCATYIAVRRARTPEAFKGYGAPVSESQIESYLNAGQDAVLNEGFRIYFSELRRRAERSPDFPLPALFRRLGASGFQQLLIIMALAPELDRKYEHVFSFLQENTGERRATVGLAIELYRMLSASAEDDLRIIHDDLHPINRFVLAPRPKDGKAVSALARPLVFRRPVLGFLLGGSRVPASLERVCERLPAGEDCEPLAGKPLIDQAVRFAKHYLTRGQDDPGGILEIWGAPGSGKRYILGRVAKETGKSVVCIDCGALPPAQSESRKEIVEEAAAFCFHTGAIPALINFEMAVPPGTDGNAAALRLMAVFTANFPLAAVCGTKPAALTHGPSAGVLRLSIPAPTKLEQQVFWVSLAAKRRIPLSPETDTQKLAGVYSLTPGQIRDVLAAAEAECISLGLPHITGETISRAVRSLCRPKLSALATPLSAHFTSEDLMLEPETERLFAQLRNRIRYRFLVGEEWGFDRKLPYGRGISVLLYGPPGTGKTMSAQVLAGEFGLDAYRIDLSRIIDKYIGETEKKLRELFDAAKDSNAILFFDEADALFAKRTEVSDSTDRYANAETAFLLQLIEEHNGISILATNATANFDEAFRRRFSFIISLPMPGAETRKKLWRSVFPAGSPLKSGLNLDFFAERFELSGSSIKSIAVSAAYIAASENTEITRDCIVRAIREEYLKTGRVLMEHELY